MKKTKKENTKHREPSKASLQEISEVNFSRAVVLPNHHAARIDEEGITIQVGKGARASLPMLTVPRRAR
jgi:hypothetical protein